MSGEGDGARSVRSGVVEAVRGERGGVGDVDKVLAVYEDGSLEDGYW